MADFTERVLQIVRNIPAGSTMSYGEVAVLAGSPQAARAVGSIMKKNTDTSIPCHRVIKSNGDIGEYNGLRGTKEALLDAEKVIQ